MRLAFSFFRLYRRGKVVLWVGRNDNIGLVKVRNNELLLMSDLPSSHARHPLSISLTRESKEALKTPAVSTVVESFRSWLF